MKALSVKQPWASLIMSGHKEVEVRTWKTDYRGQLVIHTGKRIDRVAMDFLMGTDSNRPRCKITKDMEFPAGCILGKIKVLDVVPLYEPNWKDWKPYHCIPGVWPGRPLFAWWLSNPIKLKNPIPYKGQQGLFNIQDGLIP